MVEKRLRVENHDNEGLRQPRLQSSIPLPPPISAVPMAEAVAIRPPTFSGKAEEDANCFVNSLDMYIRYRENKDANKKLNLLAVLLTDAAGDWYESLPHSSKDSSDNLRAAFASRYQSTDTIKFKCATEIVTKKQGETQSVDDYVTQMCKLAKLCSADENILKFAIIHGLKP